VRHALDPGAPRVLPTLFRIPVRCGVRPKNALVRDGAHSGKLVNARVNATECASFASLSRLGVEAPLLAYAGAPRSGRASSMMKSTMFGGDELDALGASVVGLCVAGACAGAEVVEGRRVVAGLRVVGLLEKGDAVFGYDVGNDDVAFAADGAPVDASSSWPVRQHGNKSWSESNR